MVKTIISGILLVFGSALWFDSAIGQSSSPTGSVSIRLNASYGISAPNGGWGWGSVRLSRFGAEIDAGRAFDTWLSAAKLDRANYVLCALQCHSSPDAILLQGGLGYRYGDDSPGRFVPFVSIGATYEHPLGGQDDLWMPALRGGVEWIAVSSLAVRLGLESEWQFPARVASGITLLLP